MEEEKFKIGIVGHGFVGKAVDYGFTHPSVEKFYVDPLYNTTIDDLVNWEPNMVFICAPTPMNEDGTINATIVEDATLKVLKLTKAGIAIKSTVTPDIIQRLAFTTIQLGVQDRFVYNPEFLTEANAKHEFINPEYHIMGGTPDACDGLTWVYKTFSLCNMDVIKTMGPVEASFVKYAANSFMALKVTFFNQLYDAVESLNGSYNIIVDALSADSRMGKTHMKVPGFDGKRGFGGACFPKDTAAFNNAFKKFTLLENTININNEYRSQYELDEREKEQNVNYGQTKKEQ